MQPFPILQPDLQPLTNNAVLGSMAAGSWSIPHVVDLINRYKSFSSQMRVEGKPFVSTFEGPEWAANWPRVREQTGGIFLVPDWSSLGPHGVGQRLDVIDGACKFDSMLSELTK